MLGNAQLIVVEIRVRPGRDSDIDQLPPIACRRPGSCQGSEPAVPL